MPTEPITRNMSVYAVYDEIATTVADAEGKLLVEGRFIKGTVAKLVRTSLGYVIELEYNGAPVYYDTVTVKFLTDKSPAGYRASLITSDGETELDSRAMDRHIVFSLSYGEMFRVDEADSLGEWWIYLLIALGGTLLGTLVTVTVVLIRRGRKKAAESTPEAESAPEAEPTTETEPTTEAETASEAEPTAEEL